MEKQDKKTVNHPAPEDLAKALESLKGKPLPTDTEPLREYIPLPRDLFKKD